MGARFLRTGLFPEKNITCLGGWGEWFRHGTSGRGNYCRN